jgi:hypothetical protein
MNREVVTSKLSQSSAFILASYCTLICSIVN